MHEKTADLRDKTERYVTTMEETPACPVAEQFSSLAATLSPPCN